jgi:glyoxylase-like metal-dependent hydrolase (beta-lactamase superfamily II)
MQNLSWKIGGATITRIVESEVQLPIAVLLPAATPNAVSPHRHWLQPHFLDGDDNIRISFHSLVVESLGKIIVVDTCIGEHGDPFAPDRPVVSRFLDDMATAGFARESVDVVLCTHLHYDHVGWNTMRVDGRWVPTFPNARYLFAKEEFDYWRGESATQAASNFNDAVRAVFDSGQADLVTCDHRINSEVVLLPTPGHSPGHVSVLIESAGRRALITGDMTHHPVQWAQPDWSLPMVDYDSSLAGRTRRATAARYAGSDTLVIGTHYPAPTAGLLVDTAEGVRFQPRVSASKGTHEIKK